ncbi:hypothetical protein OROHE_012160 [Orobanche hederae]
MMRRVMKNIIGESQSAFVKGRNIMDGIVILNEIIEEAKQRKKRLFFKVDFAKAYDSVEWDFLLEMLVSMNFPVKWVGWIRECLSSASANVLVNGSPSGEFQLKKGLRQGDPLSPFLFLVVAEGLNLLIGRAVERGILAPVLVGRSQTPTSHLQYADDTILLVEGDEENARVIKAILDLFRDLSGLSVNYDKCAVSDLNLGEDVIQRVVSLFGCRKRGAPARLPRHEGGGRFVYWGPRDVDYLDSIGNSYLPNGVLADAGGDRQEMSYIAKKVPLGEDGEGKRKIAWVKWKELCRKKGEGALGFKDLKWFNAACLGKWCWRLLVERDSLWARILRSRYGEGVGLIGDEGGTEYQGAGGGWWRSIVKAVGGISGGWFYSRLERVVGNGRSCRFWHERWRGNETLKSRFPRLFHLSCNKDGMVGDMGSWEGEKWRWDLRWRRQLGGRDDEEEAELMQWLEGVSLNQNTEDGWSWGSGTGRGYSVKKAYDFIAQDNDGGEEFQEDKKLLKMLWKAKAPLRNKLPTKDKLIKRVHIPEEGRKCPCCAEVDEGLEHLLLRCKQTEKWWSDIVNWTGAQWAAPKQIHHHFVGFTGLLGRKKWKEMLTALWLCVVAVLWNGRNRFIFENVELNFAKMKEEVKSSFWNWGVSFSWWDANVIFSDWSCKNLNEIVSMM